MSQEILEIVKEMGFRQIETQLILQCAPVMTGLKTSNLLIISKKNLSKVGRILRESVLSYFLLYAGEEKIILLLYDASKLEEYLSGERVRDLLENFGYEQDKKWNWISILRKRYRQYVEKKGDFPHEMGLFLGYPVEDVVGFIENSGKNSLYSGYWKVYGDVAAKIQLFQKFDRAKENLIQFLANGMTILEMIDTGKEQEKEIVAVSIE